MKRFWLPALVVMFIALLPTNANVAAQGQEQAKQLPTPEWKQKDGLWKTDLGEKLPEIVVLTLSDADFHKYFGSKKKAMAYLDGKGFFKAKLIQVKFADVVPAHDGQGWYIVVTHTLHSTAIIVAWQG